MSDDGPAEHLRRLLGEPPAIGLRIITRGKSRREPPKMMRLADCSAEHLAAIVRDDVMSDDYLRAARTMLEAMPAPRRRKGRRR